ncbi:MAG: DUF4129 domain-containing protein [Gaiella sp.]
MDGSRSAARDRLRRSAAHTALPVGLLVLALTAVAIAAGGGTPVGRPGGPRATHLLADVAASAALVLLVLGGGLWCAVLFLRGDAIAKGEADLPRRNRWAVVAGLAGFALVLAVVVVVDRSRSGPGVLDSLTGFGERGGGSGAGDSYQPRFATLPITIGLTLAALALVAWVLARRAGSAAGSDRLEPMRLALADVLAETIDDLRHEVDPRRAVVASYARMERALDAYGVPRDPAESQEEYVQRVGRAAELEGDSVARLSRIYAWARFSGRDVPAGLKEDAIETLVDLRDELRRLDGAASAPGGRKTAQPA